MTRHLFFANVLLVCVAISAGPLLSQTFPVTPILTNGGIDDRINIVCIGDGYTAAEMSTFVNDVTTSTAYLFAEPPYAQYMSYFNVYAIEVPSNESGTDHPNTAPDCPAGTGTFYSDTYFNSSFDASGIHRLLVVQNSSAVFQVLQNNFPQWDIVFLLVNHPMYGGSGGTFATFSLHESAGEIAIHELGHSFASLADEYDYGGVPGYEAANTTAQTMRELIKWNNWILATTPIPTPESAPYAHLVGLFEGAVYNPTGWYRPKLDCLMRGLFYPFCEVCSEQTIISIYEVLSTIESYDPPESAVTLYKSELEEFSVATLDPSTNTVVTSWYVDGNLAAEGTNFYLFNAAEHTLGPHLVEAMSQDTSAMVRTDPHDRLKTTVGWSVSVTSTPTGIGDGSGIDNKGYLAQNSPNPFNPSTTIRYFVPAQGRVSLVVYDVKGRAVRTLVNGNVSAGDHVVEWNGLNDSGERAASGIYFCRLIAAHDIHVKKMVLLK
ncbi:MAG: T9SS type A sorting domain-containing protein [Candidatus Latescibacterota bacterium]|nr:MAG: T9SS type A sorting domain-containing protein [Candidatus Latescibacterota bacterium]